MEPSELELLTAWLAARRARGDARMTRSAATEVRHVCLYAAQQLQELRTSVLRPEMEPRFILAELHRIIADLHGLAAYVETGRGGTSHLGDRNAK
jgi:hypothetical protein